jgi:tetratricopeptide (TPR) repeat protein
MFVKTTCRSLTLAIAFALALGCTDQAGEEGGDAAWTAYARHDYDTAEGIWRSRLAEAQSRGATDEAASVLCSLSMIYERRGALEDAEAALKQCIAQATPRQPTWTLAVQRLAQFYSATGDTERARAALGDAMEKFEGDSPSDRSMRSELLLKLASLYQRDGETTMAERAYRQSVKLAEASGVPSSTETAGWRALASLYQAQGRIGDAVDACERWLSLVEDVEPARADEARKECTELRGKE